MPKQIDYPRASLRSAIQLAEAVHAFGGTCTQETAAEKLGKKLSGAFAAQIGATVKYGLITSKSGKLVTTPLFKNYSLAYTPDEEKAFLREAFLLPSLFQSVFRRFENQSLPTGHFEKLLVREFEVPAEAASRVAGYFNDGAKQVGLIAEDGTLHLDMSTSNVQIEDDQTAVLEDTRPTVENHEVEAKPISHIEQKALVQAQVPTDSYSINILGPGVNFSIDVREADDLEIVKIMLKKIEKAL